MAKQFELYKCLTCGNIFETMHEGVSTPECCGNPMKLMKEGETDGAKEKHVPVIEKTATGYKVSVGSVAHPMEEKHWIQWIELIADGRAYHKFLKPGDTPEAEFCIKADSVIAREYCNLHGHWKAEI
jgi:desulfoferrodoxin